MLDTDTKNTIQITKDNLRPTDTHNIYYDIRFR